MPNEDFSRAVRRTLAARVVFYSSIAGFIGWFGISGFVIRWFFQRFDTTEFWSINAAGWTFILGCLVVGSLLGYGLLQLALALHNEKGSLLEQLEAVQNRANSDDFRYAQEQAYRQMALVYGYHIKELKYTFTISCSQENPLQLTGVAKYRVTFICNRHRLSHWSRVAFSSNMHQCPAKHIQMSKMPASPVESKCIIRPSGELIEVFKFPRSITQADEEVTLTFQSDIPEGTFDAVVDEDKTWEFISISPREPVERLVLEVEFEGWRPKGNMIESTAQYNPADFVLFHEAADVHDLLDISEDGGNRLRATLGVPFPLLGVRYLLRWKLPASRH